MKLLFFLLLLSISPIALADEISDFERAASENNSSVDLQQLDIETLVPQQKTILFGHNLSATTQTLQKNVWSVGNLVLGYGATDRLTLATSPWMLNSYNMYSAIIRYRIPLKDENNLSLQVSYFKTARILSDLYQMEALSVSGIYHYKLNPIFSTYLNLNYMYFWDETAPFSLRPEPYNDQAWQYSATLLNEIKFYKKFGSLLEFGVLGINAGRPRAHMGVSLHYQGKNWLTQLGYSISSIPTGVNKAYTQNQAEALNDESESMMHPEIQLQYFF